MEGHTNGVITSTCILANGEFYNQGIKEVLPEIPKDWTRSTFKYY